MLFRVLSRINILVNVQTQNLQSGSYLQSARSQNQQSLSCLKLESTNRVIPTICTVVNRAQDLSTESTNCVNEQRKMLIRVLSRINKLCHFLTNFKQSHIYNLHVCQILSLISTFGPKNDLEFGSCLEYCSTLHFPYYHKCPFGNVKKIVVFQDLVNQ